MASTNTTFPPDLSELRPAWLLRSSDEALLTGVSAGLARATQTNPLVIRFAFVLTSLAVGLGLVLYLALWALASQVDAEPTREEQSELAWRSTAGFILFTLGVMLAARSTDLWVGTAVTIPLICAAAGSIVLWSRNEPSTEASGARRAMAVFERDASPWRVIAGGLIVVAALVAFVVSNISIAMIGSTVITLIAVAAAIALLLGPFIVRLIQNNQLANRERIRSDERAEVSAHLHDSVLHTLALIQRSEHATSDVVSLARSQERDLRAWLQGRSTTEATNVQEAIDELASAVESDTGIRVESVVVGEAVLTGAIASLMAAIKEAAMNAGRHSGAAVVSIYVEVEDRKVTAFVRDTGAGFDAENIDPERRGIRESIDGRMRRNGGTAVITTRPGEGTEVEFALPLEKP